MDEIFLLSDFPFFPKAIFVFILVKILNFVVKMGDKKSSGVKNDCRICFESGLIATFVLLVTCSHVFHRDCLERLGRESHGNPLCPICRTPFRLRQDTLSFRFHEFFCDLEHVSGASASAGNSDDDPAAATSGAASTAQATASASVDEDDALQGGLGFLFYSTDDADDMEDEPDVPAPRPRPDQTTDNH